MAPRNSTTARYVVEIRDSAGESLLLTTADWTAKERDLALLAAGIFLSQSPFLGVPN